MNDGDIREIFVQINELRKTVTDGFKSVQSEVGAVKADVAEVRATQIATLKTHSGQLGVLFEREHEVATRVSRIEADYVPQSRCEKAHDVNAGDHERFRSGINCVKTDVTKIMAVAGAGIVVVEIIARAWK